MTDYTPTRFSTELVARLRGHIARYDLNQNDLAALCDVSQSQFSKIIRGVRPITVDQIAALCAALDLTISELVGEVEAFLEHRDGSDASPVRFVWAGEKLSSPEPIEQVYQDAWARASDSRMWGIDVRSRGEDYDLVANESIDEASRTTDADYDNA